jgi:hypothetical protein
MTWTAEGGRATGIGQEEEATNNNAACAPFCFGRQGRGSLMQKHVNRCTHRHLLQQGAHCCCFLSSSLLYNFSDMGGVRGEGEGDRVGGRCNQRRCCLRSLFFDSRGGEAWCGSTSTVAPIIVSCKGWHIAVVVSPCRHHTVGTTWLTEGGMAMGIGRE